MYNPEVEKEGIAQLEALGFCMKCGRPFVRQWIAISMPKPSKSLTGYEKVCPTCLLEMISNPDE